jgi:thiamine-phosphate pyrophosphorylase
VNLSLIVITDAQAAQPRSLLDVVRQALMAGAPAVQLRDKSATARALYNEALALRRLTSEFNALLFINDRLDVALAAGADGVHLGPDDMPVQAARRAAPAPFLIGWSTDDPAEARRAEAAGADYIGTGAVFGTLSKEVGGQRIGPERLALVVQSVRIPVVGIGGIEPANVAQVALAGAAGAAVIRSIMSAPDPGAVVSALLAPFSR